MARLKLDLHSIYNRGRQIDEALNEAFEETQRVTGNGSSLVLHALRESHTKLPVCPRKASEFVPASAVD